MGAFNFINYMKIGDLQTGAANQERLNELRDRAEHLAHTTGHKPVSWYEFKQAQPAGDVNSVRAILIGAVVGAALAAAASFLFSFALPVAMITGALFGGAVGGYADTNNLRRSAQIDGYEQYLMQFEAEKGRGKAPCHSPQCPHVTKDTHAADLLTSRQQQQHNHVVSPS